MKYGAVIALICCLPATSQVISPPLLLQRANGDSGQSWSSGVWIPERAELKFFGAGGQWNITLKLAGDYDKAKGWINTSLSVPSKSDFNYSSDIAADLNIDTKKIGATGTLSKDTTSQYYIIIDDPKNLKPTSSLEVIPGEILKASKSNLPVGTKWPVLKGELHFTVVKLSKKHFNGKFEVRKSGLTLTGGATVDFKQSGTMEIFLAPNSNNVGTWSLCRVTFGQATYISESPVNKMWRWVDAGNTKEFVNIDMKSSGARSKEFKEAASSKWLSTK